VHDIHGDGGVFTNNKVRIVPPVDFFVSAPDEGQGEILSATWAEGTRSLPFVTDVNSGSRTLWRSGALRRKSRQEGPFLVRTGRW
jgi:hypothetical protein